MLAAHGSPRSLFKLSSDRGLAQGEALGHRRDRAGGTARNSAWVQLPGEENLGWGIRENEINLKYSSSSAHQAEHFHTAKLSWSRTINPNVWNLYLLTAVHCYHKSDGILKVPKALGTISSFRTTRVCREVAGRGGWGGRQSRAWHCCHRKRRHGKTLLLPTIFSPLIITFRKKNLQPSRNSH